MVENVAPGLVAREPRHIGLDREVVMSTRQWGVGLIVFGLIVVGISLLADTLGVGAQPGIVGWKQLLGAGAGVVMLIGGVVLLVRSRTGTKAA